MLPRLRFVLAAALIAALPWLVLSSGIINTNENTSISEPRRLAPPATLAAGDLREAHHTHILAYVRRSRELERLRELANAPLSDWVAAPSGVVAEKDRQPQPKSEPPPIEIAALPAGPAAVVEPQIVEATPDAGFDSSRQQPTPDRPADPVVVPDQPALEVTATVEPELNPPLPRARPNFRKTARRSHGLHRGYSPGTQQPFAFDTVGGTPVKPSAFAQKYGAPQ